MTWRSSEDDENGLELRQDVWVRLEQSSSLSGVLTPTRSVKPDVFRRLRLSPRLRRR